MKAFSPLYRPVVLGASSLPLFASTAVSVGSAHSSSQPDREQVIASLNGGAACWAPLQQAAAAER